MSIHKFVKNGSEKFIDSKSSLIDKLRADGWIIEGEKPTKFNDVEAVAVDVSLDESNDSEEVVKRRGRPAKADK